MIQFSRLRLSGFKSFVEKTELDIGQGLNGVVGPNGCGKSNLVEALRWVMGESSAKRMRGGGMEDVIFAGTDKRSARNIAEVSLLLDNHNRQAPSLYNADDEIEVIRRIERDRGSAYKINGKNARARDVQMLFADTVTGSNSPALVSQGHVTRMINAKPHDRRLVLEESAGISGLYARRHEAELRLKAADSNLVRLEDILGSMESRLSSLKRQARQAGRYRNVNAQIRQMELIITYLEWQALSEKKQNNEEEFGQIESVVAEKLAVVTQLTKTQGTQVEELPPLRKKEAEISASLQTQKITLQRFEDERQSHAEHLREVKEQLEHAKQASAHEQQTLDESTRLLERIQGEQRELIFETKSEETQTKDKEQSRDNTQKVVQQLEERFTSLKENAAEARARQNALENQIQSHQNRLDILGQRKDKAKNDLDALALDPDNQKKIDDLATKISALESKHEKFKSQTDDALAKIQDTETHCESLRNIYRDKEKALSSYHSEIATLESFFERADEQNSKPVLEKISTKPGFEKALARAMGDSLMASLDGGASTRWVKRELKSVPPALPIGVESLKPYIDAPDALQYALSQIGVVEDEAQGEILCLDLQPGQALVSKDGRYWRWDGFTVCQDALDMHSLHLEQKNKLHELKKKRGQMEKTTREAKNAQDQAIKLQTQAKAAYNELLAQIKDIEETLDNLRPALSKIREKQIKFENERIRLSDAIAVAQEDIIHAEQSLERDKSALNFLLDNQQKEEQDDIEQVAQELTSAKEAYQDSVRDCDRFQQQLNSRRARIQAIADERISLQNRSIRAREHLKSLTERSTVLKERYDELKKQPRNFDKGQEELLSRIEALERSRERAAERLNECEQEVNQTTKALKEAEHGLGDMRENRARVQATLAAVAEQLSEMEHSIEETLEMKPVDLSQHAAVDMVKYTPGDLSQLKDQREKLTRERDGIGPVNLRAEDEAQELEQELTGLLSERNDLMQAIEELRGGIQKINKEARERLVTAFEHVNAHFQRLFIRLFGGGKAYLELIDSDDPLGAGLEIFAQPPGKALQSLSLLSGGEQTLASIALIFAMFLTNPAPICVLDEIDAPLDDANVDRVCNLLEEIAERGETRFLVITHHRLTMARMDRLYGVTMSEKGVSQLVSVDLQQSFEFIDKQAA